MSDINRLIRQVQNQRNEALDKLATISAQFEEVTEYAEGLKDKLDNFVEELGKETRRNKRGDSKKTP